MNYDYSSYDIRLAEPDTSPKNLTLNINDSVAAGKGPGKKKSHKKKPFLSRNDAEFYIGNGLYRCPHCPDFIYRKEVSLKIHNAECHSGTFEYKCEICGKCFKHNEKSKYRWHIITHNRLVCTICGYKPGTAEALAEHKANAEDRCYTVCHICGEKKRVSHFKHHLATHSAIRNYTCEICGRSYSTIFILQQHQLSHKEPKYECVNCGKKFKLKHHLKNHMLTYTEERKFACDQCALKFKMTHHLRSHKKTKH